MAVVSTGVDEVVQIEEVSLKALEAEVVVTSPCADAVVAISNSGVAIVAVATGNFGVATVAMVVSVVVAMVLPVVVSTVNSVVATVVSAISEVVTEAATKSTTILTTTTNKDLTGWTMKILELGTTEQAFWSHTVRYEAINILTVTRG